jgi:glycosyltransferase involved in cell wall biosynthesis
MKPIAIIPAYNSANYLEKLIPRVKEYIPDNLVINDGSTDQTSLIAEQSGATVLSHVKNLGKGAALKTGFQYAVENNYDPIITLDSDGQHDPKYIHDFLRAYTESNCDIIIGSRVYDKADMPWDRRFSNWATSHIVSLLLKTKIEDLQCGYRLYSRKLIESLSLESDRFELETEIVIKAFKAGFVPHFIPIVVEYGFGFPTQMNRFVDTIRWWRCVLEYL